MKQEVIKFLDENMHDFEGPLEAITKLIDYALDIEYDKGYNDACEDTEEDLE